MRKGRKSDPISRERERHPERIWMDNRLCYLTIEDGEYVLHDQFLSVARSPDVLLWFPMVACVKPVPEGMLVGKPTVPWFELRRQLAKDTDFLFQFAQYPRKFEEFIAGMYHLDGWNDVILTPRSCDYGRDVIATSYGSCSVRILDSVKAYSRGNLVRHTDVRDMFGVICADPGASKGAITTTTDFEPKIAVSPQLSPYIPYRLQLRNGAQVLDWLKRLPSS
jgi:restriction system protein